MEAIATLEELLEQGQEFVHILYTFRSVARAVPLVRNQDDANRSQLHHETFKVQSQIGTRVCLIIKWLMTKYASSAGCPSSLWLRARWLCTTTNTNNALARRVRWVRAAIHHSQELRASLTLTL